MIDAVAEKIIYELKKEGFVIHRYDSQSSRSVYIRQFEKGFWAQAVEV